jgi:hypothetical protein
MNTCVIAAIRRLLIPLYIAYSDIIFHVISLTLCGWCALWVWQVTTSASRVDAIQVITTSATTVLETQVRLSSHHHT